MAPVQAGTLYVVATPIGNLGDLSPRAREVLAGVAAICAEDTRHTRHLLSAFGLERPLVAVHDHNEGHAGPGWDGIEELLQRLGLAFETASPHCDETPLPAETPRDTAPCSDKVLASVKPTIANSVPRAGPSVVRLSGLPRILSELNQALGARAPDQVSAIIAPTDMEIECGNKTTLRAVELAELHVGLGGGLLERTVKAGDLLPGQGRTELVGGVADGCRWCCVVVAAF